LKKFSKMFTYNKLRLSFLVNCLKKHMSNILLTIHSRKVLFLFFFAKIYCFCFVIKKNIRTFAPGMEHIKHKISFS
jgi:hypothetical protein